VGFPGSVAPRAKKVLKAFARVELDPGETRVVRTTIPIDTLRYRDTTIQGWRLEAGPHSIHVGGRSDRANLTARVMFQAMIDR
jgi:beta-glucosidase